MSGAFSNLLKEAAHANVVWVQSYVIMESGMPMLVGSDPHPARTWDKKGPRIGLAVTAVACHPKVNNSNTNIGSKGR